MRPLAAVMLLALAAPAARAAGVLWEGDSAYSHITVTDEDGLRCLYFGKNRGNGIIQSCIQPADPDHHVFEYTKLLFTALGFAPAPKRVLVVGLGGGIVPAVFARHAPDVAVDVVEVDQKVVDICRKHFLSSDRPNHAMHVRDGRIHIKRATARYDIVVLDAFLTDYIPFHLMTVEFVRQVRAVLAPGGVVVANVHNDNALFDAQLRTWEAVFPGDVHAFTGNQSANTVIAAAPGFGRTTAAKLVERLQSGSLAARLSFDLAAELRKLDPAVRPAADAPVLEDDRAPVHSLQRKARGAAQ